MKKNIRVFIMLIAMTLSIIPSDTNIVKAAQTVNEYTDENAAFKNKLFSLAVENKINFTDRTGKGYATFTAKDTARYRIEINDYEDQRMTIRIHDDVENNYVEHIKAGKNDYFSYNMTEGRKYTIEVEKVSSMYYASCAGVKILPQTESLVLSKRTGIIIGNENKLKIDTQVEPASIKTNGLITYRSLDEGIATVDENGVVTAVKAGSTSINISTYDNYEETFYVTVISTDSVLSEKELTVNKKASADIKSGDAEAYFTFTPKNTTQYNFMIEMQKGVGGVVYIYKGDKVQETEGYIASERGISNADISCELEANQVYTVRVCFEDSYTTGSIDVLVREKTKDLEITGTGDKLIVGLEKTMQLNAKVTTASGENNEVTWASEDEGVAIVNQNGLVTSVNMGTTNITATTWDGVVKKYEIVVQEPQISLNEFFVKMRVNEKFTLKPVLTYDDGKDYTGYKWDEVLFISRDESVVRVTKSGDDKCILKAAGRGNTVVDVTMKIGTRSYEMSCEVNVKGPYLNCSRCYLYIGNTQKVKVLDKKGTLKWSTSNKKVATVSKSGKITAKKRGNALIICKVDGVKLTCSVTVDTPYMIGMDGTMTEGLSCKMRIIGSNSSKKERWSSSNKKILTVKNGKITAKKTGVATLKCKVNGITIKKKVTVHKNVYTQPSAKIKDMLLDRIYYQVVKTYFSGNKLKVKIKLYNTYTDRKLKVIKALDVKIYANGRCLHQRVVNKKVNMKAYSSKTITVTVSKNSKMKHAIDLRNNAFTSDINLQTAYYSYKYTY